MIRALVLTIGILACAAGMLAATPSHAQSAPVLWHLGFTGATPPANLLPLRRAVAFAVDRTAIAKAVGGEPAFRIQHRRLPGDDRIRIPGHTYDAARARALRNASGWTGPITILAGPASSEWVTGFQNALTASLSQALGVPVTISRMASLAELVQNARRGAAPIFVAGWRSSPQDEGYPWNALGLASTYFPNDRDVTALARSRQVLGVEQLLLDRAMIVPIVSR